MSIKEKYKRDKPEPPKRKGNADIIGKIVNNDETVDTVIQKAVSTERNIKKATFELDANLHKRLRVFAMMNDTTMVDIVEKAIVDYLDRMDNNA